MTVLGVALRWLQLGSALSLVGLFAMALCAGRSDRPTARAWEARCVRLSRWLVAVLLVAGIGGLAHQATVVTGRASALAEPSTWLRLLLHSQFGTVWMARHAIILLLAAFILFREREAGTADWIAWRAEAWLLAAAGAAGLAWAGHAAAVEPWGPAAILADALHILAAGAWVGALVPLALLLRAASTEAGADARPFAVLTARRFSGAALVVMVAVAATGLWNAWVEVASIPALVGTRYGWLLLVKLLLLVPVLALAAINRRRLLPALSGEAVSVGRPAMARLGRFITWEATLAAAILLVTGALTTTPPGRHESPYWPFSHRLAYDMLAVVPGAKVRLLIGSQLALLGVLGLVVGCLVKQRRAQIATGAAAAVAIGLWIALPPLAVDAYPTTYVRPTVPYQVASIDSGMTLFAQHCAVCHGADGVGDGPGGAGLPRPPADLTAPHTGQHTAGDLFWWLTHGIPAGGMPAFGGVLAPDDRWDLINFLRALSAGQEARALAPVVEAGRPSLAAPDFTYAVGPSPPRTLKEQRGRSAVLLVLFTLPGSKPRLDQLAGASAELEARALQTIAVPMSADPDILRRLGGDPPILFPVATEGAADLVRAYLLFRRTLRPQDTAASPPAPPHMEMLIDRQGYIRARWLPSLEEPGWRDLSALTAQVAVFDREAAAPPPEEHVH